MRRDPAHPHYVAGAKDFPPPLLRFGILFLPALLFAVKSDLPHVLLFSCVLILAPLFMRKALEYGEREIIYSALLILLMVLLPDMFFRMDASRLGLTDAIIRSDLSVPFLLYTSGVLMLFRRNAFSCALSVTFPVFASLLCGDIFSIRNLVNERLPAGNFLLEHFTGFYGLAVLLQCVSLLFLISPSAAGLLSARRKEADPPNPHSGESSSSRPAAGLPGAESMHLQEIQEKADPPESPAPAVFRGKKRENRFPLFRPGSSYVLLKGFYFLLIPCLTLGFIHIYTANRENLKKLEMFLIRLNASLEQKGFSTPLPRRTRVNLDYIRYPDRNQNAGKILIWAKADSPPGYLRTDIFQRYFKGSWQKVAANDSEIKGYPPQEGVPGEKTSSSSVSGSSPIPDGPSGRSLLHRRPRGFEFSLPAPAGKDRKSRSAEHLQDHPGKTILTLSLDSSLQQLPLPIPGNAGSILLPFSSRITVSDDGEIHVSKESSSIPYTVKLSGPADFAAYPGPSFSPGDTSETIRAKKLERYMEIPEEIIPALDSLRKEIFPEGGEEHLTEKSLLSVYAVTRYLSSRFHYALEPQPSAAPEEKGTDPVSDFITRTRSGHCEFFASTAALLFRRLGFPSRYVCGYLCIQPHPSGADYYYATGRNAHAWCEVYLPEYGGWIPAEPTPSFVFENMIQENKRHFFSVWLDSLRYFLREILAMIREGNPGEMLLKGGKGIALLLFRSPPGLILLCALLAFCGKKYLKKRKREWDEQHSLGKNVQIIRKEMSRMERLAGRYAKIPPRAPSETFREWILRADPSTAWKDSLIELQESYEALRFRPGDASEEERSLFLEECRIRRRIWKNLLRNASAAERKDGLSSD